MVFFLWRRGKSFACPHLFLVLFSEGNRRGCIDYYHSGTACCEACLAQEGGESAFSDSDYGCPLLPIDVPVNGWLSDYLPSLVDAGDRGSADVELASKCPSGSSCGFPTDSSCSLGAVHSAGHHSDSSHTRFDGGMWLVGYIDLPSPSAAEEDHLDPRGFEEYIYDERSAVEADTSDLPPPAAVKAQVPSDDKEDLFSSSKSAGEPE